MKVPPGTQAGKRLRLRGKGVPDLHGSGRGDFYVRVMVHVPERAESLSEAELILRETDDLKKITDTVSRQIIDRAMRRVEGNQSRAAEILNISRGSLIAKLKEYQIPDYRYLRRERTRRP